MLKQLEAIQALEVEKEVVYSAEAVEKSVTAGDVKLMAKLMEKARRGDLDGEHMTRLLMHLIHAAPGREVVDAEILDIIISG